MNARTRKGGDEFVQGDDEHDRRQNTKKPRHPGEAHNHEGREDNARSDRSREVASGAARSGLG